MTTAGDQLDRDANNDAQLSTPGAFSLHDAHQDADAKSEAAAATSAANTSSAHAVQPNSANDLGTPQASPFAAAAGEPALDARQPAAAVDIVVERRLPLIAASRTVTTGLESDASPATDTTMRAGASAPSPMGLRTGAEGSGFAATARQAVHSGPTGPGAVTPETSLSTGLGSNPSVRSDQTLPPAPSGELAAVFAFAEQSSSGHPAAAPRSLATDELGARSGTAPSTADKATSVGAIFAGATPQASVSTGLPDGGSVATDETLANVAAGDANGRARHHAGHPPRSPSAAAAALQQLRRLRRDSSSGRRTGTSEFLSSLSRTSPVPNSPPAAAGDGAEPPAEPSSAEGAPPLPRQDACAQPGGEARPSAEPLPEGSPTAAGSPLHGARGITTIHERPEQGSAGSGSAASASSKHEQSDAGASQPALLQQESGSHPGSSDGGSAAQHAAASFDVAEAQAQPDSGSRCSELAGGDLSGDDSDGSSVTSRFVPTAAQLAAMPRQRREAIADRSQRESAAPRPSASRSAAAAAAPTAHLAGPDTASDADSDAAPHGNSSSEGSVSPPQPDPMGHDSDEYPDLDEALGADEPLAPVDTLASAAQPPRQGAGSARLGCQGSPISSSPGSTTGQDDARMPSIGSEIANLSIANGSGASAAGQLASLGEQPAVRAGANADSEGSGPHSDGQPSSATSGAHRSGGGGSPAAQHGSEAVSLMQRQLAQLRLEGGGRAAPEHPQPEGKRLRRAASPAAGAPAPPGRPAAMKQAAGDDGAAAEPPPQGTSGSVSPQGFAGPQQPHFTLGVPGNAMPTAKRRQLPPAAQAGLATGPQPMPPSPWPLPGVTPPLRHAQPPPPPTAAAPFTAWQQAETPEMSFTAVSDAWERRTSPAERSSGNARRPLTRTRSSGRSGRPGSSGSPVAAATASAFGSMAEGPGPPAGGAGSLAGGGSGSGSGSGAIPAASTGAPTSTSLSALLGALRSGTPEGNTSDTAAGPTADVSQGAGTAQGEHDLGWRRQKRHFFILTHAGKPVFTRYGDESALAGFTALLQALAAFAADRGDSIQSIRSGRHVVVVAQRGPLLLVAVSSGGEPTSALRRRLDLLHGQVTLIVTNAIDRLFTKNPRYDGRSLLVGTGPVLRALAAELEVSPWGLLPAFPPAPLPAPLRAAAVHALKASVKDCSAMYGVLLCDAGVVALASQADQPRLHPADLLLLATFLRANDSLRQGESMCPVCLPRLNPGAFLHAYIAFLHPASGLAVALLSAAPDAFLPLSKGRALLEADLNQQGVTAALIEAAMQPGSGRLRLCSDSPAGGGGGSAALDQHLAVPAGPLLHFVYHVPARRQYLAPLPLPPDSAQDWMAAVARLHVAVFGEAATDGEAGPAAADAPSPGRTLSAGASAGGKVLGAAMRAASGAGPEPSPAPRQRMHFTAEASHAALAYAGPEFVLYAMLDPLVAKAAALDACNALCAWLKPRQAHLFLPL